MLEMFRHSFGIAGPNRSSPPMLEVKLSKLTETANLANVPGRATKIFTSYFIFMESNKVFKASGSIFKMLFNVVRCRIGLEPRYS